MPKRSMTSHQILEYWRMRGNVMWEELRQQHNLPIPVPRPDREELDNDFRDDFAAASEGELPELLDAYRDAVEKRVQSLSRFYLAAMKRRGRSRTQERVTPIRRREHRNAYQEFSDSRYLRILAFVSQRSVSFGKLMDRSFETGGYDISWDALSAEWNKASPEDRLAADTLKRYYYRARADKDLCQRYFDDLLDGWAKAAMSAVKDLMVAGCRPEDLSVKSVEGGICVTPRFSPEVARAYQRAADRKCALMAHTIAYERDTRLCHGSHCRRCNVGSLLVGLGIIDKEELSASAAAAAVEKWKEKFRQHTRTMRMLLGQTDADQGDSPSPSP